MFDNKETTPLSTIGEFGLIDHLTEGLKPVHDNTVLGIGDDAAILKAGKDVLLVSTDMLVENVHFDVSYTPLKHLGYKAIVVNISDICAMNAVAEQVTVSLAISSKYTLEAIEELYLGMRLAAEKYKVDIVGGDTTSSASGLVISVTAIGRAQAENVVKRKGARANDIVIVTGDLGGAYMGLQILEREKAVFEAGPGAQPDLSGNDYVLERQLKPEARTDVIRFFEKTGIVPTSMIDVSDGLASELLHLCKHSELGCTIYEEKIPIDPTTYQRARDFNLDPTTCALNGGEDYELLFTIKPEDWDKVKTDPNLTAIGYMTEKAAGANLITPSETMHPITAQGWDALRKEG
jgi:thiamine-monophosphate kinase